LQPIGRIINRFSKDQDVIDSLLMDTLRMITFMAMSVTATFIMIAIVTPIILAPLFPIFIVYYLVQHQYRHTSRELKRIESIARSPLFSHFNETLTGLATIRAYRAQESFIKANEARMDGNNRSYYLLVLTQRWLSIRVETIGALIAFFAALFVVVQRDSLNAGEAGVSLSYALGITATLNWVVRQTVEAENSMNSVERCKFYTDSIAQEEAHEIPEVDEPASQAHWPQRGVIQIEDLQLRYRDGLPLVLHGISLNIKGGERIGIVGRTGAGQQRNTQYPFELAARAAQFCLNERVILKCVLLCTCLFLLLLPGKSSLMVALFRIVEAAAGRILIDGIDIRTLGLDALRSKLAIIPQDPVLFSVRTTDTRDERV
jgi:ATP-binding cassette subfamily C (CFTR/MRP) protein 1